MKFSSAEEYGLRCLMNFCDAFDKNKSLTIPEISRKENIPEHTIAKILRELRLGGFLVSERGHLGGYSLARPPEEINIGNVLKTLGGKLYEEDTCKKFSGLSETCIHTKNCKVRKLWEFLQQTLDEVLLDITLRDLTTSSIPLKPEKIEREL